MWVWFYGSYGSCGVQIFFVRFFTETYLVLRAHQIFSRRFSGAEIMALRFFFLRCHSFRLVNFPLHAAPGLFQRSIAEGGQKERER